MFQNKLLLSVLSGLLLMVSFPFSGSITPLVFVAWIPLWRIGLGLRETKRGSLKFFGFAYLSLFIFNLGTTWWIWNSTTGGAVMAFVCNTLLMSGALTIGFILFKKSSPILDRKSVV
jgi:apolipoprotein N-acyltransferase